MNIITTELGGVLIIEPQIFNDRRGYFFESYSQRDLDQRGLSIDFVQDNESCSGRGVVRGLHYQLAPYAQTKLVRVVRGCIFDVLVDIRRGSPTFGRHLRVELSDANKRQVLVPKGFAHGFSVLSPEAIICYKCDTPYHREAERGIAFNDPALGIDWGISPHEAVVSDKDAQHPPMALADMNFDYGC